MSYQDIQDYGIIGNMCSCALVGLNGSIDWACFPRFDSPSVFAAILDDRRGGRFQLAPRQAYTSGQRYAPDTNVLETTFTTAAGSVLIIDFMPLARPAQRPHAPHEVHRLVRGLQGAVEMQLTFQPRFGYATEPTAISPARHGVVARQDGESMALIASLPLSVRQDEETGSSTAEAAFTIRAGEEQTFVAAYGRERTPSLRAMDSPSKLDRAARFWRSMAAKTEYDGLWRDEVIRSFLILHLLTYEPTGAIVAAATASLPENLGGERNWDYRYCWLRDSAWTVGILFRMGDYTEGEAFIRWLIDHVRADVDQMQVLYGIDPASEIEERTLDHLEGYRGSKPVRVGNGAAFHRQLDVYGEVVLSLAIYHRFNGRLPDGGWELVKRLADLAAQTWRLPDRSIWEVRGPEQHFVYSKFMCWVALDRASHLAETQGYDGHVDWWRGEAAEIRKEISQHGWSESKQSFVQRYGSDAIDASALLIPFVGFLPPDDPRVRSTIRRVDQELSEGPFVRRYLTEETDDGLEGGEGAFLILSFWLIGGLLFIGEREEALRRFQEVLERVNHVGLLSEMVQPHTYAALGNFPQAFSHIGLMHTARNLSMAARTQEFEEELLV